MENKKLFPIFMVLCIWVLSPFIRAQSVKVTHAPQSPASLDARWAWAIKTTNELKGKTDFYIGYSIQRMMGEHSHIGSWSDEHSDKKTLYEIVYGKEPPTSKSSLWKKSVSELARMVLEDTKKHKEPEKKVSKDVAVLFRFNSQKKSPVDLQDIKVSNLDLWVKFDNCPLFWLGKAENKESINLLERIFNETDKTASTRIKERIVMAVGIHGDSTALQAIDFLEKVLKSKGPDKVREQAAFWLGQQQHVKAVNILMDTAVNDSSRNVRKKAVFGLYLINLDEADDALIQLAKHGKDREVRKKAIFWLGRKAVKRTAEVLTDVVNEDKDAEIQKAAVFALSQLPHKQGVPQLIKIAKTHKSLTIRKKAIFWLSQSEDPRALDTIIEIVER
jgi:HEAT repeat protein